jgi:hypothetical protein
MDLEKDRMLTEPVWNAFATTNKHAKATIKRKNIFVKEFCKQKGI